ncbi:MAG TPA: MlaD family protein [Streptosporangiaceae bacterium]|nr:MlaD family protein [Streptosporangiaceae bacterium]
MRSRWNLPIFIGYAAASLAVLVYLFAHMGGSFAFQSSYQVAADFTTANNLVPGDDVTISGVTVGRVASVQLVQGGARVHLQLREQYAPLYRDARAMIKIKNLLNESYVELYRGTAASGPLPQGGTIPASRTLTPVEVAQVLDVLNPDTRQQLASLIDNLGESVAGRGQDLNSMAGTLKTTSQSLDGIAHAIASQQANLGSLITSLSKVLATLAAWHTQLSGLVTNWNSVMQALAAHEQELQGLIVNENRVMSVLDQAFARNSAAPGMYSSLGLGPLTSQELATERSLGEQGQVSAILGQTLAGNTPGLTGSAALGSDAEALHAAIQELPQLVNSANHYATNGGYIFGKVSQQTQAINELFYELASVFSATDSQGNHYWRVYPVSGGLGTLSQPLLPSAPSSQHVKKGKS